MWDRDGALQSAPSQVFPLLPGEAPSGGKEAQLSESGLSELETLGLLRLRGICFGSLHWRFHLGESSIEEQLQWRRHPTFFPSFLPAQELKNETPSPGVVNCGSSNDPMSKSDTRVRKDSWGLRTNGERAS